MKHTIKTFPHRLIEGYHASLEALSEKAAKACPSAQSNDGTWRILPALVFPLLGAAAEGRRA